MSKNDWLIKRTPRTVAQLRLWPENPRLNPDEPHVNTRDYVEDIISDDAEKKAFLDLITSIGNDGFIPADPIVVWKNESNEKYYVAEGNRRVLALKLLLDPNRAPKSIRGLVKRQAAKINANYLTKIPVCVSPSFEDAEWYINQRNSISSLNRTWTRIQQLRWIFDLYSKHDGDIEKIKSITKLTQSELDSVIRTLKIKDFVNNNLVQQGLTEQEYLDALSSKFPITILERFFSSEEVKSRWGLEFNGEKVLIHSNEISFFNAYTALIKRILANKIADKSEKVDTRTITTNLSNILDSLPTVSFEKTSDEFVKETFEKERPPVNEPKPNSDEPKDKFQSNNLKNNPDRSNLIMSIYEIRTDSYRLEQLFKNLKKIPFKYLACISASLRVFLDLSVLKYIQIKNVEAAICREHNCDLRSVTLSKRLSYVQEHCLTNRVTKKIITRLLDDSNQFSLETLNGFVHNEDTHYLNKQFFNQFWDFLFPLLQELTDIYEVEEEHNNV